MRRDTPDLDVAQQSTEVSLPASVPPLPRSLGGGRTDIADLSDAQIIAQQLLDFLDQMRVQIAQTTKNSPENIACFWYAQKWFISSGGGRFTMEQVLSYVQDLATADFFPANHPTFQRIQCELAVLIRNNGYLSSQSELDVVPGQRVEAEASINDGVVNPSVSLLAPPVLMRRRHIGVTPQLRDGQGIPGSAAKATKP